MARYTGAKKHTHSYARIRGVWRCMGEACTHFMPGNMPMGPMNQKSVCWNCDKEFVLAADLMVKDYPICYECTRKEEQLQDVDDSVIEAYMKKKKEEE